LDQLLGVNGHVFLQPQMSAVFENQDTVEQLEDIPGVRFAVPTLKVQGYAVNGSFGESGVYIQGVRREDLLKVEDVTGQDAVLSGSFASFGQGRFGGDGIALASGVARTLGTVVGDAVTLITGNGKETPFGRLPTTQKTYRVDAIFSIGNYEYDSLYVYMPLAQAQLFAGKRGEITEIELRAENPMQIDAMLPAIRGVAEPNFIVFDWRDRFRSFFDALQVERGLVRIILAMIVGVATLLIFNGLWMQVKDKNSDIAVLRTMGGLKRRGAADFLDDRRRHWFHGCPGGRDPRYPDCTQHCAGGESSVHAPRPLPLS
ncbi:MAG: ABC transporter permease, partial [Pseudomonadota bacterium]